MKKPFSFINLPLNTLKVSEGCIQELMNINKIGTRVYVINKEFMREKPNCFDMNAAVGMSKIKAVYGSINGGTA